MIGKLVTFQYVSHLDISNNPLFSRGNDQLAALLVRNRWLVRLDIRNTGFSHRTCEVMCLEIERQGQMSVVELRLGSVAGKAYKNSVGLQGARILNNLMCQPYCVLSFLDL